MGINIFAGILISIVMLGNLSSAILPTSLVDINNRPVVISVATLGQKNAIKSAQDYLTFMPFSRQGLIDQLSSPYGNGYLVEEATYAVDYLESNKLVDWNEQAAKCAENYINTMPFFKKWSY